LLKQRQRIAKSSLTTACLQMEEVAMRIYKKIIAVSCPSSDDIRSVANISDTDAKMVSAVSWLLLTEGQRSTALREANRLIRRFLGARKHAPACAVFEIIPADSIEVIHRYKKCGLIMYIRYFR
jgi:hypothetical protein